MDDLFVYSVLILYGVLSVFIGLIINIMSKLLFF